ncbi:uncharacterized protein HD556DRAFT_1312593 [Suillus plorans]|uniref:Uncharacterized protein n=1 Tax=Suillus plorans TaxID=116603 RepID=A0A9P7DCF7_9AGAM|nr:uncharacterized protein HD556DRAFT_1312593 [Suillus plorans]KAG1787704.1 hypothetical protein HD556DRAFT_1312593 [Suillus plorans]
MHQKIDLYEATEMSVSTTDSFRPASDCHTVVTRIHEVDKESDILDLATAKHGFEAALLMCGKVVNQDASIRYIHTTSGAEEFWASRCHANEDTMVGHFKAHVYHQASLAVVEDIDSEGQLKPPEKKIALPGWRMCMPAVAEEDDEVQEVPDNLNWKTLADHI